MTPDSPGAVAGPWSLRAAAKGYLLGHWRGRHPLALSFWGNLVLPRVVLIGAESFLLAPFMGHGLAGPAAALFYFLVAHVAVQIWQVVGVLRALERHQSAYGSPAVAWGVHFGVLMSLVFTLAGAFASAQNAFVEPAGEPLSELWERERAARYALVLSDDGRLVRLTGSIELNVTRNLAALLERARHAKTLVLDSPGGNAYEARGVARLVRERGLDTHVAGDCFSVCTLAFAAGATRTLGPAGRLGFHQYGLDADYQVPFVDIAGEQAADRAFLGSRGVAEAFLARVFEAPHDDLWIPTGEELLAAGVVHRLNENLAGE